MLIKAKLIKLFLTPFVCLKDISKYIHAVLRTKSILYADIEKIIVTILKIVISTFKMLIIYPTKLIAFIKYHANIFTSRNDISSCDRQPSLLYSTGITSTKSIVFNKQAFIFLACLGIVGYVAVSPHKNRGHFNQTTQEAIKTFKTPKMFAIAATSKAAVETAPATLTYVMVRSKDNTTFSSAIEATVISMPFKEGESFKKGETLIKFDCRIQKAELQKAEAQKKFTDIADKSAKKLKSYGSISEAELAKALSDLNIAIAEVNKWRAVVDQCTIKAPYNGAVSEKYVQVGESIKSGEPLLKTINTQNLELQMQVPSSWLTWLHVGSTFSMAINEIQKTITAKVSRINPQIDPVSQTVRIVGLLTTPDPNLLPGMTGQATFQDHSSANHMNIGES